MKERNSILRLLRALRTTRTGVRVGIAANVLAGILCVALSLLFVWLSRETISSACNADTSRLNLLSIALCGVIVVRLIVAKCRQRIEAWCITRFSNRMRGELFSQIITGGGYLDEKLHSADIVNRMSSDVGSVSAAICTTLPAIIVSAVSLIGAFVFLVTISPAMALLVTALMPIAIGVGKLTYPRIRNLSGKIRSKEGEIAAHLQENISHRLLVATLGYAGRCEETFRQKQTEFFKLTMRRNDLSLISGGMVTVGFMSGYAVMFLYCAYGLCDGTMTFATMTALLQLVSMVQQPAVDLSHKVTPIVNASVAIDRIHEVEQRFAPPTSDSYAFIPSDSLRLANVWFRYQPNEEYVMKDLSATLPLHKVTAIYGETGAGKTTMLRLLLGICTPERGAVYSPFIGHNFDRIVYVPQGNSLLSGTILSNLLMGKPDATETEIREALHSAVADFAFQLKDALLTRCGENGDGLSMGQAQRIAIARGLLRLKAIGDVGNTLFILDEPTSSLDHQTETLLLERLIPKLKGATTVIVTHKSEVEKHSDHIIRLPNI